MKSFPFMQLKLFPANVLQRQSMDCPGENHGAAAGMENAQRARVKSHVLGGYLKKKINNLDGKGMGIWEFIHPVPGPDGE